MTAPLHFRLLGGLHISIPDKPALRFAARRAELLLAYLALNRREHSREMLATLLWDDRPHKQALANLRALLAQLPKGIRPYLKTSRQVVMFKPDASLWIDSHVFANLLESATTTDALAQALDLYAGPFLDGVFVRESLGLEEWSAIIREQLNYKAINAHLQIVQASLHQRQYATGITYARALLTLDPLREQAHRLLMRLLVRDGQYNAALAQYETCRQILADELDVEPASETTRLYQRIAAAKQSNPPPLPTPITPFMGRQAELAVISEQLDQPNCRLLTVVGPGGVGKTRLALQVAALRQTDYLNGVFFVPLSMVETAVDLPIAIAQSLNLPFSGLANTEDQLLAALATQERLLLLDNIEHLLPDASQFVARLLAAAPHVSLLVTSRERLRLPAEHSFDLAGLTETAIAEQFFVACARRALPGFNLTADTQMAVHHICRLVDGLPLGIELAAAWVHMLSCAEIAREIEQNIDFLATPERERPERHQSLRAVFEYSWRLLAPVEQSALYKLAIFRGGFTREAAHEVAGANLLLLRSLVDKSLLYRASDEVNRYGILEVLRQHVLAQTIEPDTETATLQTHSNFYGRFLQTHALKLRGQTRQETVQTLAVELENCRRAWQTAVSRQPIDPVALGDFIEGLYAIYHSRAWFSDGYDLLHPARKRLLAAPENTERNIVLSRLLARLGSLAAYRGQFQLALEHHQQSLTFGEAVVTTIELASNYIGLAQVSDYLGNYQDAQKYGQKAHDLYEQAGDEEGMVVALRKMASAAQGIGQFEKAEATYRRCLAICRRADDQLGIARASNGLGNALADQGKFQESRAAYVESLEIYRQMNNRYSIALVLSNIGTIDSVLTGQAEARTSYEESYQICEEIGDFAGMGVTGMNIAVTYEREENFVEAKKLYQQSLKILRKANYVSVLPTALTGIGGVFARLGNMDAARASLHESLEICQSNGMLPLLLRTILGVAFLLELEEQFEEALAFTLFAARHDASNQETTEEGMKLAEALRQNLTADSVAAAEKWAAETDFETVVTAVLAQTQHPLQADANQFK